MGFGRTIRPYEMDSDDNLTILEKLSVAVKEENVRVVESLLRECIESEKETILNPTYKEHNNNNNNNNLLPSVFLHVCIL